MLRRKEKTPYVVLGPGKSSSSFRVRLSVMLFIGAIVFITALNCGVAKVPSGRLVPIIIWEVQGLVAPKKHAEEIRWAKDNLNAFYQAYGFEYKEAVIIWHIRLPRILLGALVGIALALGGAALQSLFQNPLADPSIVGVSSGASVGALMMMVTFHGIWGRLPVALGAFVGAIVAVFVVFACARMCARGVQPIALLLIGVAVSAMASAAVGIILVQSHDHVLRDFFFWSFGSLSSAGWGECFFVLPWVVVPGVWLFAQSGRLNALLLGREEAAYLGVSIESFSFFVFLAVACMVGATVAVCGVIGFVGIMAPHLARVIFGGDSKVVLPIGAALGAMLVVTSDAWIRASELKAEWPLGAITALAGVPFFLGLLIRKRFSYEAGDLIAS